MGDAGRASIGRLRVGVLLDLGIRPPVLSLWHGECPPTHPLFDALIQSVFAERGAHKPPCPVLDSFVQSMSLKHGASSSTPFFSCVTLHAVKGSPLPLLPSAPPPTTLTSNIQSVLQTGDGVLWWEYALADKIIDAASE